MYQKIDFTQLGGFPLTQKTMAFIQSSYNDVLNAVAIVLGENVIFAGVDETSPNFYSVGWITYDNKIVPFAGGSELNFVKLVQTSTSELFENGNTFQVTTGYTAVFDSVGDVPFSSYKRLTLRGLDDGIITANNTANSALSVANNALTVANNALAAANAAQVTANNALAAAAAGIPVGMILLWSGSIASIPVGFVLCNGSFGTPDLRDKFVAGAGSSYAVNAQGGANTVTLSIGQMPSHNHRFNSGGNRGPGGGGREPYTFGASVNSLSIDTSWVGGDPTGVPIINGIPQSTTIKTTLPHENRPPYWALCYIMKV